VSAQLAVAGARFPGGATTLAILFTEAKNAGATIIVKIVT
jgi:hypothetical protein